MGWLEYHGTVRDQFRSPRRDRLRGVIVVHTAESVMDTVGPDTGAENVARFIAGRTDPGSYHDLVDSDSFINLVDYDDEAYHDGTGSNRWSLGLSFACSTTDWQKMSPEKQAAFIEQGAIRAANMARYVHAKTGIVVPARRISREESERGVPGLIAHGTRDPSRRSDPGTIPPNLFPWDLFLTRCAFHAADLLGGNPNPPIDIPKDWLDMATKDEVKDALTEALQGLSTLAWAEAAEKPLIVVKDDKKTMWLTNGIYARGPFMREEAERLIARFGISQKYPDFPEVTRAEMDRIKIPFN